MAPLNHAMSALLLAAASAAPIAQWDRYIAEASVRFGVPQDWIRRVVIVESGGRSRLNGNPITSPAGAMGLMQLMPATWDEMRYRYGLGPDPFNPRDNVLAGAAYLRAMYNRFGYPGLFSAYDAGPGRYAEHLAFGSPLPPETRAYLAKLAGRSGTGRTVAEINHAVPNMFVRKHPLSLFPTAMVFRQSGDGLFAIRR
jgi:soluble lytic murein transglycosylase-like protein